MSSLLADLWERATNPAEPRIDDLRIINLPSVGMNEPLVDAADFVATDPVRGQRIDAGPASTLVRLDVARRLRRASEDFALGQIVLVEGHRSQNRQQSEFDFELTRLAKAHPSWDARRLHAETAQFVAPPDLRAPHAGGGAVDITVVGFDGEEIDTGCVVNGFETPDACFTGYPHLTKQQRFARAALVDAMTSAGFANYAHEWWHWSFGDRLWAWTYGRPAALYDGIDDPNLSIEPSSDIARTLNRRQ